MSTIPEADKEMALYYDMANEGRIEKYGEWVLIDSLASIYNYTHDQVFLMGWSEVMRMIMYNREKTYISYKAEQIYKEANKKR